MQGIQVERKQPDRPSSAKKFTMQAVSPVIWKEVNTVSDLRENDSKYQVKIDHLQKIRTAY
jgi:hypothetical protein